jgi:hypothetical protein
MSALAQPPRRRRQIAATQATIARAVRVAKAAGPEWQVVIEGDIVRLIQGAPPPIIADDTEIARGPAFVP